MRILAVCAAAAAFASSAACMPPAASPPSGPQPSSEAGASARSAAVPANLVSAEQLVDALNATAQPNPNNAYTASTHVIWGTPGQPQTYRAFTECASLTTAILMHSYPGWATPAFVTDSFGSASPLARDYEKQFSTGAVGHFTTVPGPAQLLPGDILAVNYRNGSSLDSGHVATIRNAPTRVADLDDAGRPAWVAQVVDSTDTPHGNPGSPNYARYPDTRWYGATTHTTGAGYGYLVLYADATGRFAGYRWSPSDMEFHDAHDRPLAAARISP